MELSLSVDPELGRGPDSKGNILPIPLTARCTLRPVFGIRVYRVKHGILQLPDDRLCHERRKPVDDGSACKRDVPWDFCRPIIVTRGRHARYTELFRRLGLVQLEHFAPVLEIVARHGLKM